MIRRLLLLVAGLAWACPALAAPPAECTVARSELEYVFPLRNVARAIVAKKLDVLVVGSGSSTLRGPNGVNNAYPARLQKALSDALPGVAVKVATDVKSRRTAAAMLKTLKAALTAAKPALVIWQTGTVDAMQAVDTDTFSETLDQGVALARAAGADVILVNSQYSPRTELMIALSTYIEDMRWVALQYEIPMFDRFAIMKLWADLGTFDFTTAKDKLAVAGRVHNCIGLLLADMIVVAAKNSGMQPQGR